jgi:hypothetical protein
MASFNAFVLTLRLIRLDLTTMAGGNFQSRKLCHPERSQTIRFSNRLAKSKDLLSAATIRTLISQRQFASG